MRIVQLVVTTATSGPAGNAANRATVTVHASGVMASLKTDTSPSISAETSTMSVMFGHFQISQILCVPIKAFFASASASIVSIAIVVG